MFRHIRFRLRRWTLLAALGLLGVPALASAQSEDLLPYDDPDYGICPDMVSFTVPSQSYPGGPYAGHAILTRYLIGFARYSFYGVKSQDGLLAIDGFFYIDYLQCRFRTDGVFIVEFPTVKKVYALPTACGPDNETFITYDPYSPSGGNVCSGSGGGWIDGGAGPGGTTCHYEYLIIEISYDGGTTWQPYWEGYAKVCA